MPLRTNIVQFNAKGGYEKKKPDLVVNHHDDVNAPFILHGEPKVWFGGDWQPTIQKLKDDLDKLDLSFNYGVCKVPVMIVVYDPQGLPAPKGVSIPAICAELATHPNVKVLEYPVDMCQPPASSQGAR